MPITVQAHFILTTAPLVAFIILLNSQLERWWLTEVAHMLKGSQLVHGGAYTKPVDPEPRLPAVSPHRLPLFDHVFSPN